MLRSYQAEGIDWIKKEFSEGTKKILLKLSTGAGKTVIFSDILKGLQKKGNRGIMLTRGRKLIDQAHQRLKREDVDHGVLMAGHPHYNPNSSIQLCSVDTLRSRNLIPRANLIVVDEAHFAISPTFRNFISLYPEAYVLGVTATPFVNKSLRHIADKIICPISASDLIRDGWLVDGKYYAPKSPDISKVRVKSTGDYDVEELSDVMSETQIVGDVVTEWLKLGENRSTFCFCVDIKHSKTVCEAFGKRHVTAEHCDANTPDNERNAMISRLEKGITKVICSVGTMTTGVDVPSLGCLILARPTQSYILHLQMLGRGTRPFPGKENFLVLDHASNLMKHGTLRDSDKVEGTLDGKPTFPKLRTRTCKECFGVFAAGPWACPYCGYKIDKAQEERELMHVDGSLEEFKIDPIIQRFNELKKIKTLKHYKRGWLFYQMSAEFGEEIANKFVPKRIVPSWVK